MPKKIDPEKKAAILQAIAAGQIYNSIADQFGVSLATVKDYGRKNRLKLLELKAEYREQVFSTGLATVENRVDELTQLYNMLKEELPEKKYKIEKKISANGKIAETTVLNTELFDQLRGVLGDIAKEVGGRQIAPAVQINNTNTNQNLAVASSTVVEGGEKIDDSYLAEFIRSMVESGLITAEFEESGEAPA